MIYNGYIIESQISKRQIPECMSQSAFQIINIQCLCAKIPSNQYSLEMPKFIISTTTIIIESSETQS